MEQVLDFLRSNTLVSIFLIAALGYLLGSVRIRGVSLGTAGILIVALVFGHFEIEAPAIIQSIGLVIFVTSVGFIAGPKFFRNFRGNAANYILLGVVIIGVGVAACIAVICLAGLKADLALGLLAGALTTTPGLAAALEATGSDMVFLGYGIAYPFGVISVVLFVQLVPKLLKADMEKERENYIAAVQTPIRPVQMRLVSCEPRGFFGFTLAIVLGLLLGQVTIPLPGRASFSLGTSGGPLFAGLILGHMGRIGKLNVSVKSEVLVTMREFGLALFLIGAGSRAGAGFVQMLAENGVSLFFYGAAMALLPMIVGYFVAVKLARLSLFNALGSICGGMTSTPALGTLIQVTGTDDVASAYAATYPVALVVIVVCCQLMGAYFY